MDMTPEQVLVYNYFIKYETLKEMTKIAFSGSTAEEVNIYLDLTRMMDNLYNPNVRINYPLNIAATLINLCAHMRTYYRQYHSVETNFFMIYSDMTTDYNRNLVPEYGNQLRDRIEANKVTTDAINIALSALEVLVPYLPNIYLRKDIHEPAVVIYDTILKEQQAGNTNPNIILTKEPLVYQVVAMLPDTVIFRDYKHTNQFEVVTHDSVIWSYLFATNRRKLLDDPAVLAKINLISPELLGAFITLTNLPSRSIKSIMDSRKAINTLSRLISQGQIYTGYVNDTNYLYSCIFNGLTKVSLEMFLLRYNAIDLLSNYLYYATTPYANHTEYRQDLHDPEAVQEINNQYFTNTAMDLNRL